MSEKMDVEQKVYENPSDVQISQYDTHEAREEPPKVYGTFSMIALAVSLMATWEALGGTMGQALVSGGPVSLVYGFIASFIGNMATSMSLAEAAAMWPSAGGQYQFVAELSPPSIRSGVSWYCGWLSVLGWISFTASAPAASSNLVMGLVSLNYPDFVVKTWHSSMVFWAITLIALGFNLYGNRILPYLQNFICALHVGFFFAIFIATLAVNPEKNSAAFVFTEFRNSTGWSSDGIAWCLGMLTSCYVMIGYDSATHLSEEIPDPARNIPRAMIGCIAINGSMGFVILIVLLFCMGNLDAALNSGAFPIIHIFSTITGGNKAAATAMTCTIIISASFATFGLLTTASRILWAFARDGGTPFSSNIGALSHKRQIPTTAIFCSAFVVILLGALNIASTTAFAAILTLTIVGLNLSYLMPVVLLMYRRILTPGMLNPGPFKLKKFGVATNVVSIAYLVFTSIFLLFPTIRPVTAKNMNYGVVVLGGVLFLTTIDYFVRGRKVYTGPRLIVNGVAPSE